MSRWSLLPLSATVFMLASCRPQPSPLPAIGEAFAGPATLIIRKELPLQSPVVATVKHGDRLEVIQTRRRFVEVRTAQGAMGWTDGRLLLTPDQMRDLRRFTEAAASLPSQGTAFVYEALNVHTEPSRASPSFIQIPENGTVQVIGHRVMPKVSVADAPPAPLVAPRKPPKSAKKQREKEREKARRTPPLPRPPAPKPPTNWQALSRPTLGDVQARTESADATSSEASAPEVKPPVIEDWSLIRTKDGRAGWVLSRMVTMSIPDEVAQYAEGQRITSYFSLGDIADGDQTKHVWLWTTLTHGGQPFEFDGFRVFVWSLKHHRYETVYRGRDVQGYYPVAATKGPGSKGEGATFSLVLDNEGHLIHNTYVFNGYRVNLTNTEPYAPPRQDTQAATAGQSAAPAPPATPSSEHWYSRLGAKMRGWFR